MKKTVSFFVVLATFLGAVAPISANENIKKIRVNEEENEDKKITSGIYTIVTRLNEKYLEPGIVPYTQEEAILFNEKNDKDSQKWMISEIGSGVFAIISLSDGRCIGIDNEENLDEAKIVFSEFEDRLGQKWVFKKNDDGSYTIRSCVKSDYVLQFGNPKGLAFSKFTENIYQAFKMEFLRNTLTESQIESSIDEVYVDSNASDIGDIFIKVSGAESNASVSGVVIDVTSNGKKKKTKTIFAKNEGYGNFSQTLKASLFDYASGEFEITLRLLLDGVYLSEIGTYTCTVSEPFDGMEKRISKVISESTGTNESWQVSFVDLKNNKDITINSHKDLSMNLIKLFVMGAVYDQYDAICAMSSKENVDATIKDMIVADNDIALGNIFSWFGSGDYAAGAKVVTDWANNNGYEDVLVSTAYTGDYCSAKDATQFWVDLYNNKFEHSEDMLKILAQQVELKPIASVIPKDVKNSNKAGLMGRTMNDSAIIYSPNGDYVLTIMSNGIGSVGFAQQTIQKISQECYKFLND